jgi:cytochrome P450
VLSQEPEIEKQMHAEIDRVLGGRLPTTEDLKQLKFVEGVFAESLRLFPPGWILGRQALGQFSLGGYTFPAGSYVLMSPWVMHHDERYYPNSSKLDPSRWTDEAKAARPKFSFFAFGGGPRVCLGEAFAWMEAMLLISTFAQKWKFRMAPGEVVRPKPTFTLGPKGGLKMTVHART